MLPKNVKNDMYNELPCILYHHFVLTTAQAIITTEYNPAWCLALSGHVILVSFKKSSSSVFPWL